MYRHGRIIRGLNVLYRTVRSGRKAKILNLLQYQNQNLSLRYTDENGNTVLHLVLKNEKLLHNEIFEIVEMFLNQGVDPNIKNKKQQTGLHLAVARRLKDVVDILVKYKAKINTRDSKGNFITHFFIKDEYEKFRKILELENSSLNFCVSDAAAEKDSANFVEWLISKGFDFDAKVKLRHSALSLAINRNLFHILPALLKDTNDVNYMCGDYKKLLPLFMQQKYLMTPFYARYVFHIVKILLDRGLQVTIKSDKVVRIIKMLIDQFPKNFEGNKCAMSMFHAMMRNCEYWSESTTEANLKILGDLVARGVNVSAPNEYGLRPVFWAVWGRNIHALKFLEENGVDFHMKRPNGQNLLGLLVERSCTRDSLQYVQEVFEFLISKGCDVNEKDNRGTQLLHLAAELDSSLENQVTRYGIGMNNVDLDRFPYRYDCVDYMTLVRGKNTNRILSLLLRQGAYVNARDKHGKTALYRAVLRRQTANIKELLEWGADVNDECMIRLPLRCPSAILLYYHFIQHWIKLKAADLPCSKEYEVWTKDKFSQQLYNCCLKEVVELKTTSIHSCITLHHFLSLDLNSKCFYVNNDKLKNLVDSPALENQFPLYSAVILASYRESVVRKSLLEPAKDAWLELTTIYLPNICIERILTYLDNNDLVKMTEEDRNAPDDAYSPRRKVPKISLDNQ